MQEVIDFYKGYFFFEKSFVANPMKDKRIGQPKYSWMPVTMFNALILINLYRLCVWINYKLDKF